MSETIILFAAVYASSLVILGLLLNMREFSRLNRPERLEVDTVEQADRLRTDSRFGYAPGYTGA